MPKTELVPLPTSRVLKAGKEYMSCKLTDDERLDAGERLGNLCAAVREMEAAEAGRKKVAKDEIETAEGNRDALARVVREGQEQRLVEFEDVAHLDTGRFTRTRLDTLEIVIERALRDDERQGSLI